MSNIRNFSRIPMPRRSQWGLILEEPIDNPIKKTAKKSSPSKFSNCFSQNRPWPDIWRPLITMFLKGFADLWMSTCSGAASGRRLWDPLRGSCKRCCFPALKCHHFLTQMPFDVSPLAPGISDPLLLSATSHRISALIAGDGKDSFVVRREVV
jgi:hypothetical protein